MSEEGFDSICKVLDVDAELGLVFGWALTSFYKGEEYFDTQGHSMDAEGTVVAALDFAKSARISTDMHARDENGDPVRDGFVPFMMPITEQIAKAFEVDTGGTYGLMIGLKPSADVFAKYKSGEYTSFSIGGRRVLDSEEVVE